MRSCDHFLRIAELKTRRKDLGAGHIQETMHKPADLYGADNTVRGANAV
jgi:hypothetical protein